MNLWKKFLEHAQYFEQKITGFFVIHFKHIERAFSDHLKHFSSDNTIHIFVSKVKYWFFSIFKEFSAMQVDKKSFQVKIWPLTLLEKIFEHYFSILEIFQISRIRFLGSLKKHFHWNKSKAIQNLLDMNNYCVSRKL